MATSLEKSKMLNGVIKPFQLSTNSKILVKIGPLASEQAWLRGRPLKKFKKLRKIIGKIYSPSGKFAERAKLKEYYYIYYINDLVSMSTPGVQSWSTSSGEKTRLLSPPWSRGLHLSLSSVHLCIDTTYRPASASLWSGTFISAISSYMKWTTLRWTSDCWAHSMGP